MGVHSNLWSFINFPQKKVPLSKLLTGTGCVQIKSLCMQNLHLEAHSEEENTVLDEFLSEAKEVNLNLARREGTKDYNLIFFRMGGCLKTQQNLIMISS